MASKVLNRIVCHLKTNPGSAFIIGFEILLIGAAAELWKGNGRVADDLGVAGFILVLAGVALQTVVSIRSKSETPSLTSLS